MNDNRFGMALLFPLLAGLIIVGYAGGLGVAFMVIYAAAGEFAVVGVGAARYEPLGEQTVGDFGHG